MPRLREAGGAVRRDGGDWTRASIARDRAREAESERRRAWALAVAQTDEAAHVALWDVVAGLALLLGRDRAIALVIRDLEEGAGR